MQLQPEEILLWLCRDLWVFYLSRRAYKLELFKAEKCYLRIWRKTQTN